MSATDVGSSQARRRQQQRDRILRSLRSNKELMYSERELEMGPNRKEITRQVVDFSKWEKERGGLCLCGYTEPHSLPSGDRLLREGGNS